MNAYDTAQAHLAAVMGGEPGDSIIVLHRDAMPALPAGCYAVVRVEILSFDDAVPHDDNTQPAHTGHRT